METTSFVRVQGSLRDAGKMCAPGAGHEWPAYRQEVANATGKADGHWRLPMNPAFLLPRGQEVGPITARPLLVHASDNATCIIARRGLIAEGSLTSLEEETLELDVYGGEHRTAWLTR